MSERGKQTRTIPFTDREKQILDMVVEEANQAKAAKRLSMPMSTVRTTLFRIRVRYDNARRFVEACEEYQRKLPRTKRFVTG